ncbi:MAG: hypothetical protein QOI55_1299 [Actinomycetota bacterium]|nr:hypothetical protein [Actinomycetota bacterium]
MRASGTAVAFSLALVLPAVLDSGCTGTCKASCVPTRAEITVGNGLAAVEVCDGGNTCARQEFGPADEHVVTHAFTFLTAETDGKVRLRVRGFLEDGTESVSRRIEAKFPAAQCGCKGPAKVWVNTDDAGTSDA